MKSMSLRDPARNDVHILVLMIVPKAGDYSEGVSRCTPLNFVKQGGQGNT